MEAIQRAGESADRAAKQNLKWSEDPRNLFYRSNSNENNKSKSKKQEQQQQGPSLLKRAQSLALKAVSSLRKKEDRPGPRTTYRGNLGRPKQT